MLLPESRMALEEVRAPEVRLGKPGPQLVGGEPEGFFQPSSFVHACRAIAIAAKRVLSETVAMAPTTP